MKVMKTEEWCEDYGDCLFFHFENFKEAPTCTCVRPDDVEFDGEYFTHFVQDFDFNDLFEQAMTNYKENKKNE